MILYHIAIVRNENQKTYTIKERASVADTTNYTTSTAYEIEIANHNVTSTYPTKATYIADVRIVSYRCIHSTVTGATVNAYVYIYSSTTNVNTSIPS